MKDKNLIPGTGVNGDMYELSAFVQVHMMLMISGILLFTFLCFMMMMLTRIFYKKKLKKKLSEIHQVYEPGRIFIVENGANEAVVVRPPPISPPISDQTEYNVVAAVLRDDQKGNLF